jgi:hypothetical protein
MASESVVDGEWVRGRREIRVVEPGDPSPLMVAWRYSIAQDGLVARWAAGMVRVTGNIPIRVTSVREAGEPARCEVEFGVAGSTWHEICFFKTVRPIDALAEWLRAGV